MKNIYQKPVLQVELFTANQAVASCDVSGGIEYTFDCMAGKDPDIISSVISTTTSGDFTGSCRIRIGYSSGSYMAQDYSRNSNSEHSDEGTTIRGQWGGDNSYLQVTYTGAIGMFYADSNGINDSSPSTENWSVTGTNKVVVHDARGGGVHHIVAPLISAIATSW